MKVTRLDLAGSRDDIYIRPLSKTETVVCELEYFLEGLGRPDQTWVLMQRRRNKGDREKNKFFYEHRRCNISILFSFAVSFPSSIFWANSAKNLTAESFLNQIPPPGPGGFSVV